MRKARRIDSSSLPAVDPLADDPMERAVQTDMDLLAKSRPKRFLARLRGELDARAEAERAAAEGERRGAGWGRRVPHVPQVGPRVLDTKELKSALQKAKAEQEVEEVDTVSPMPMSRVESKGAARRRVGFGATGAQSPASRAGIFTLADAQQGLFGVGTWGQAKRALDGTGSKSGDQGSQDAQSNGADRCVAHALRGLRGRLACGFMKLALLLLAAWRRLLPSSLGRRRRPTPGSAVSGCSARSRAWSDAAAQRDVGLVIGCRNGSTKAKRATLVLHCQRRVAAVTAL